MNSRCRALRSWSVLTPRMTPKVLTTASLAVKPETRAVTIRQSPKPRGANRGETRRPRDARMLAVLSVTTLSLRSKLWRNQMMTVAMKMTVNARVRKSSAFSHISRSTLLGEGSR